MSFDVIWNNRVLALLYQNKDEWFSANEVSEHFKLTIDDALSILHTHLDDGNVEKKDNAKDLSIKYKFNL